MRLSAVVLTHNEGKRIERCLESIRWISDIVIVDDQSCDDTVDICKQYTDKILVYPLENDFAAQRNRGTQLAQGDWILQLDADEVIPEETRQLIESALEQDDGVGGYSFIRTNYFLGRKMRFGGWSERMAKLFRKGKGWYQGEVHELLKIDGPVKQLPSSIDHYPFEKFSDCLKKLNHYTTIEAKMMLGKNPNHSVREIYYQISFKPLKLFWKIYIKKQAFREGLIGFVFASFWALGHLMKWAKYWEMSQYANRI